MSSEFKGKSLVGRRFIHLEVLRFHSFANYPSGRVACWECRCDCGKVVVVFASNLTRTKTNSTSCGCDRITKTKLSNTTHGCSSHPICESYSCMMTRCTNPDHDKYKDYGGRGIIVCERWLHHPENFIQDMLPTWKEGLTLDRINTDGDYEPSNCEWRTQKQQCRNKRNNHTLEFGGLTLTVAEWAERLGILDKTIYKRIYAGWSVEKALTTQVRARL